MRLIAILVLAGCSAPSKPAPATQPVSGSAEEPAVQADVEPAVPATPIAATVEWTEIRSWDGLFVIGVPKAADVDEFLMAIVPIRGQLDDIEFSVRLEKNPLTTAELVAYQPSADGAHNQVVLDSKERVKFEEHYQDGGARTALHDVVIHRGKTMAIVWESIYRRAAKTPDAERLSMQAEMASRFRLEKPAP